MKKRKALEARYRDFVIILKQHTRNRLENKGFTASTFSGLPIIEKANILSLPGDRFEALCRFVDESGRQRNHFMRFVKRLEEEGAAKYHHKVDKAFRSGKRFSLPSWVEFSEKTLAEIMSEKTELDDNQRKLVCTYFSKHENEDNTMTKIQKEKLRKECEAGKHALPYEVLVKDQERRERIAKRTQETRMRKIAKEELNRQKNEEEFSEASRNAEVDELRKKLDECMAALETANRTIEELRAQKKEAVEETPQEPVHEKKPVVDAPEEDITAVADKGDFNSKIYPRLSDYVSRGIISPELGSYMSLFYSGVEAKYKARLGYSDQADTETRDKRLKIYSTFLGELKRMTAITPEVENLARTILSRLEYSFCYGLMTAEQYKNSYFKRMNSERSVA